LIGQTWEDQAELWEGLDERQEVLNTQLPTQVLDGKAPLEAYPHAAHSGRPHRPEWEEELLDLERVYRYLAHGRWFRQARAAGTMQLAGYRYYLGRQWAGRTIEADGHGPAWAARTSRRYLAARHSSKERLAARTTSS
jgi:hypothetical protein